MFMDHLRWTGVNSTENSVRKTDRVGNPPDTL